jgi:putative ABC transport system permease protein
MNSVFGIPAGPLAVALTIALAVGLGVVGALAVRNRIFFKLGVRNIPRRRGRTALIVVGLMLGTAIISAALTTGDTMSHTIRSAFVDGLGSTDELVSVKGTSLESMEYAEASQQRYFDQSKYVRIREAVADSPVIDGVAPAIVEDLAVQNVTRRQNEPRVTLVASEPAAFASFATMSAGGASVTLADLRRDEVYLNAEGADELGAHPGDRLSILVGDRRFPFRVKAALDYSGPGNDAAAMLMGLESAQQILGAPGQIQHVIVSNRGGPISGAELSDEAMALLQPVVAPLGLEADNAKEDGLERADAEGNAFMSLFTTFGGFSIAAGILLIFLIFVMLAAERRSELGIARAVGTRRSHLVQMYLFEGVAYDVIAALVGALLGILVAFVMVLMLDQAFASFGFEVERDVRARSILIAYTLGVLLTLVVVTISAWRVSVLNIASAVRNLAEPAGRRHSKRRWFFIAAGLGLGVLLTISGIASADGLGFMLGVSLVLVSLAPVARSLGARDRIAYTAAGLAIVVFWLLPFGTFDFIADFSSGFGMFLAGGLLIVVGATWAIMHNADLLLGMVGATAGRIRALAPVVRLSMAYPLRNLFRTGVTLAMFMLVVFTLVTGTTISGSFVEAWDDAETFGGGFDIRAESAPATPIAEVGAAVKRAEGLDAKAIPVTAGQSVLPVQARQDGTHRPFEPYAVTGLDSEFLSHTTFGLGAIANGYASAEDVWRAVRERPNLAVVDSFVAPRRDDYGGGVMPDFQLSGFYFEDEKFDPVPVIVRDPARGKEFRLTVVGILRDGITESMAGISTSQRTLASALGTRVEPTVYWFGLGPNADAVATAKQLESTFLAHGLEAEATQETLDDAVGVSKTFNLLIEGFMGLGLVVGVAALGVITARAVVERRQQIGVLRAIGFGRRMIQTAFLLESTFVALTAIVVGAGLGLVLSYNVIADSSEQGSWQNLELSVPWLSLGAIFLAVYVVALLTTLAPAVRASRVYPAEALRYQ